SQKAGELDLEKSNSPAFSSKKQNKLDKNRSDYKNPTYFVNSLQKLLYILYSSFFRMFSRF
ncbi:hypothetical protein R4T60_11720, partial [Bacillus paralicheniformis]|uniref:hypothetical protein n=1 Tax=Bacillus paralicheniformis TaxID=1648923 RepID=UPI00298D3845